MVTDEIVINSIGVLGVRVAISCRYCIAFEMMLLFLVYICCSITAVQISTAGIP